MSLFSWLRLEFCIFLDLEWIFSKYRPLGTSFPYWKRLFLEMRGYDRSPARDFCFWGFQRVGRWLAFRVFLIQSQNLFFFEDWNRRRFHKCWEVGILGLRWWNHTCCRSRSWWLCGATCDWFSRKFGRWCDFGRWSEDLWGRCIAFWIWRRWWGCCIFQYSWRRWLTCYIFFFFLIYWFLEH